MRPRKGKSYRQTWSTFSMVRLRFQEHTCLTSREPAAYFKLGMNFTLYFFTCGNRVCSLYVYNVFPELEMLFQHFIWGGNPNTAST